MTACCFFQKNTQKGQRNKNSGILFQTKKTERTDSKKVQKKTAYRPVTRNEIHKGQARSTRHPGNIVFLDTEFNASSPETGGVENDGIQEITQIGAVVFRQGKPHAKFNCYCKIADGHHVTAYSESLTGISEQKLKKQGIPFIQAMQELEQFLDRQDAGKIYAFGAADALELRRTAKWNNAGAETYRLINRIQNVQPVFASRLGLGFVYSLADICRICNVGHSKAHSALQDAEDTGLAYYNMKADRIKPDIRSELEAHKNKVRRYRAARKIREPKPIRLGEETVDALEAAFQNAADDPVLVALYDDMMAALGKPERCIGENRIL